MSYHSFTKTHSQKRMATRPQAVNSDLESKLTEAQSRIKDLTIQLNKANDKSELMTRVNKAESEASRAKLDVKEAKAEVQSIKGMLNVSNIVDLDTKEYGKLCKDSHIEFNATELVDKVIEPYDCEMLLLISNITAELTGLTNAMGTLSPLIGTMPLNLDWDGSSSQRNQGKQFFAHIEAVREEDGTASLHSVDMNVNLSAEHEYDGKPTTVQEFIKGIIPACIGLRSCIEQGIEEGQDLSEVLKARYIKGMFGRIMECMTVRIYGRDRDTAYLYRGTDPYNTAFKTISAFRQGSGF